MFNFVEFVVQSDRASILQLPTNMYIVCVCQISLRVFNFLACGRSHSHSHILSLRHVQSQSKNQSSPERILVSVALYAIADERTPAIMCMHYAARCEIARRRVLLWVCALVKLGDRRRMF